MTESAKKLEPGFSVADAEQPRLIYDENDLKVVFRDWRENEIELCFPDCYAVRWQTAVMPGPGERNDEIYEILNSQWLATHRQENAIDPLEPQRHFKLNFNACGQLEVLAKDMALAR